MVGNQTTISGHGVFLQAEDEVTETEKGIIVTLVKYSMMQQYNNNNHR